MSLVKAVIFFCDCFESQFKVNTVSMATRVDHHRGSVFSPFFKAPSVISALQHLNSSMTLYVTVSQYKSLGKVLSAGGYRTTCCREF